MGTPVSINMSPFEFVSQGLPGEIEFLVNPHDLTPQQWLELINQELFWLREHLRDILGFRQPEVILQELKLAAETLEVTTGGGFHLSKACRLMDESRLWVGRRRFYLLLDRNGHWIRLERRLADETGRARAHFQQLSDQELLEMLEQAQEARGTWAQLGLCLLQALVRMLDDTITERQSRLRDLEKLRAVYVGRSLQRLDAW